MISLSLSLLLTLSALVQTLPLADDMLLIPAQEDLLKGNIKSRNVYLWSSYYWKSGTLVYSFGEGLSSSDKLTIQQAMADFSLQTCVKFRLTSNSQEPQVIIQRKDSGCWSYVGYLGWLQQPLNLGLGCMSRGTIQHELLHALAFVHMQSDPKRDEFVRILYENIQPGLEYAFDKYSSQEVSDLGVGYDYDSVLHYGAYAFSKNGKPTIVPLKSPANIGQRRGLSQKDVLKLQRIYCNK